MPGRGPAANPLPAAAGFWSGPAPRIRC